MTKLPNVIAFLYKQARLEVMIEMDGVNLKQLKSFIAACESGSFSAAARKMGKVQSVVSTHPYTQYGTGLGFNVV